MASTAPIMWVDGVVVSSKEAAIPLMSHAAQRGSLVFDVGAFHRVRAVADARVALFRVGDHVARFRRSAKLVGLEIPFDDDALIEAAKTIIREAKLTQSDAAGLIRWSVFFAASEPDLIPRDAKTRVAVAAQSLQDAPRVTPLRISIFDDARKASPDVLPPETKAAAAYLGPMMARRRAIAAGSDDVVLLDRDGAIAEAPIANVFAVIKGSLCTPPLGRILPGITRDSVLAIAREEGICPIKEERLELGDLLEADEAFLTATSFPIAPIGFINDKALGASARPGAITQRLIDRLVSMRRGLQPSHSSWLTYVD